MSTGDTYHFLIFGLTSFHSLPQREQAIAIECARLGHRVDFIEIAPSVAGKLQALIHRTLSPLARDTGFVQQVNIPNLHIHTPPTLPTGFRNSLTPPADRSIFRTWFRRSFAGVDLSQAIAIVNISIWWGNFIDRTLFQPRLFVYDVCDALEVQSKNDRVLQRLLDSERSLASEVDLVTYSAREMREDVQQRFPTVETLFLPNAVGEEFIQNVDSHPALKKNDHQPHIGYIGATSGKWFDEELMLSTVQQFPQYSFSIIGPVESSFAARCQAFPNVQLHGFVPHDDLPAWLRTFDVAIIPFRHNSITRIVNPLKLYEYASAGLPVVATWTEELQHYSDCLYLAREKADFHRCIELAVHEDKDGRQQRRRKFARENTWQIRVQELLAHVHQHSTVL